MSTLKDGDTLPQGQFMHDGLRFLLEVEPDDNIPPWEEDEGCGPVSFGSGDKRPSQRIL